MTVILVIVVPLLAGGAALLAVRYGLLITTVDGDSMEPELRSGERVLVRRTKRVRAGRLVVFAYPELPGGRTAGDGEYLIKRVVAVPGDRLPSDWEDPDIQAIAGTIVPPGHLVVLGDNRGTSWDSRHYGFLDRDLLVGVVIRRLSGARTDDMSPSATASS
ncbi:S26 family signal peptidase [Actinoallomurus sp. NPDC050550]|uniref:S26 family signal peptidase n=1 Tax=Actinoallomurus sp. NPDC050550 TaxID=3154937 RepID=UPI0033CDC327